MADSDDDDGDPITNEVEVFQDEIKTTLISSLSDKTALKSIIAEVEHLRNAYKQDPSSLNRAVMKALFGLPFGTTSQLMKLTAYFERMGELFEQYSQLIISLRRDKKTQQEGGIAVADPVIHLLSSGKLSRDEWNQDKAKAELETLLSQHNVITAPQIPIAINTIDDFCRAVKLEGGSKCTSKSLKRKHEKLCTGQFSETFTHTGGELRYWMSDDYLEIPEGAIPKGEKWKITGNIHTSLNDYTDLLKKPKGEAFVAAINDYEVEGGHWFKVPVKVVIHHSISNAEEFENLRIRLHDNERGTIEVPKRTMNGTDGKGPWYEVDGPRIVVYTCHFTKIICSCKKVVDPDTECSVNGVKVYLYGKINRESSKPYCATIELYVHALQDVERLPVFWEVFSRQQDQSGYRLLNSKSFPPALEKIEPTDQISTRLTVTDDAWRVCDGSDEQISKPFRNYVTCLAQAYDPVNIFTCMLHGKESCINGIVNFSLDQWSIKLPFQMEYVPPTSALRPATTATIASASTFQAAFENQAAGPLGVAQISEDTLPLCDLKLYAIGKKLISETREDVGLQLGLSDVELEILLRLNNNNQTKQRASFEMLRFWRERQPLGSNADLTRATAELRRVLQETNNTAALTELES